MLVDHAEHLQEGSLPLEAVGGLRHGVGIHKGIAQELHVGHVALGWLDKRVLRDEFFDSIAPLAGNLLKLF